MLYIHAYSTVLLFAVPSGCCGTASLMLYILPYIDPHLLQPSFLNTHPQPQLSGLTMPKVKRKKRASRGIREIEYVAVKSRRGSERLKTREVSTSISPTPPSSPSKSLRDPKSPSKAKTVLKNSYHDGMETQGCNDSQKPGSTSKPQTRNTKVSHRLCFHWDPDVFYALTGPT